MSGEIRFRLSRMRAHAEELTGDIAPRIEQARARLDYDAVIEGGDFGITGNAAAMAYPGALQFAFEDLATHERMLAEYAAKIMTSARLTSPPKSTARSAPDQRVLGKSTWARSPPPTP